MNPHFFGRWSWHLLFGAVAVVGIATTVASAAEPGPIEPRAMQPRAAESSSVGPGDDAPEDAPKVAPVTANDVTSTKPNPEHAYEEELETLDEQRADGVVVPKRGVEAPIATAKTLSREADIVGRARKVGGVYVVKDNGKDEPLTLDPALQEQLTSVLRSYQTPYGAIVVIDPQTGKVLAMAEHSERNPGLRGLTTKAIYPAASIFKIVTAAALLEAGLSPEQTECFHGGKRRLSEKLLRDTQRDGRCMTLAAAMGASANVIFAKLTQKHLTAAVLRQVAEKLGFNRPMPFAVLADVSMAAIPETPFELASTGAGFGDVYLSPLHGALLAAVAANAGEWRPPVLFEKDVAATTPRKVLTPAVARKLTEMLEETVTTGTARRIFRERGFRVRGAVGKTGTLADRSPFRDYSWFVGFAPKDNPQVAVAAVIVNEPKWRIRATYLAREAMRLYLESPSRVSARSGSKALRPE